MWFASWLIEDIRSKKKWRTCCLKRDGGDRMKLYCVFQLVIARRSRGSEFEMTRRAALLMRRDATVKKKTNQDEPVKALLLAISRCSRVANFALKLKVKLRCWGEIISNCIHWRARHLDLNIEANGGVRWLSVWTNEIVGVNKTSTGESSASSSNDCMRPGKREVVCYSLSLQDKRWMVTPIVIK